jgi:hypothetical protein
MPPSRHSHLVQRAVWHPSSQCLYVRDGCAFAAGLDRVRRSGCSRKQMVGFSENTMHANSNVRDSYCYFKSFAPGNASAINISNYRRTFQTPRSADSCRVAEWDKPPPCLKYCFPICSCFRGRFVQPTVLVPRGHAAVRVGSLYQDRVPSKHKMVRV